MKMKNLNRKEKIFYDKLDSLSDKEFGVLYTKYLPVQVGLTPDYLIEEEKHFLILSILEDYNHKQISNAISSLKEKGIPKEKQSPEIKRYLNRLKTSELIGKNNFIFVKDGAILKKLKINLKKNKFQIVELDGTWVVSRYDIFRAFSKELRFPKSFNQNWNEFSDYLTNLRWLRNKKCAVLIKKISILHNLKDITPLLDILLETKKFWKKQNVDFDIYIINIKDSK